MAEEQAVYWTGARATEDGADRARRFGGRAAGGVGDVDRPVRLDDVVVALAEDHRAARTAGDVVGALDARILQEQGHPGVAERHRERDQEVTPPAVTGRVVLRR